MKLAGMTGRARGCIDSFHCRLLSVFFMCWDFAWYVLAAAPCDLLSVFILTILMTFKHRRLSAKNNTSQKDSCCSWRMLTAQRPSVTLSALSEASGPRTPKLAAHDWLMVVSPFVWPSFSFSSI